MQLFQSDGLPAPAPRYCAVAAKSVNQKVSTIHLISKPLCGTRVNWGTLRLYYSISASSDGASLAGACNRTSDEMELIDV